MSQAEEMFSVLDAFDAHIVVIDDVGKVRFVNEAWHRFARDRVFGVTVSLGAPLEMVFGVHGEDARVLRESIDLARSVREGGKFSGTVAFPDQVTAEPGWFQMKVARFSQPQRVGWLVILYETVTREVSIERELLAQREIVDGILEATTDAVFVKDLEGRYVLVNSTCARLFDRTREETQGRADIEILPEDEARAIRAIDVDVMKRGHSLVFEEEVTLQGSKRTFFTAKSALRNREGRVTGLVGIARDVTEKSKAEAEVRLAHLIIENVFDAVISTDARGIIETWNASAERLYGYSQKEANGHSIRMLYFEEEAGILTGDIAATLAEREFMETVQRHRRADGQPIDVALRLSVQRDSSGRVHRFIGCSHDITSARQVERALRASEARYRAVVEDQAELVCRLDEDASIRFVNHAFCRFFDVEREQAIDASLVDIVGASVGGVELASLARSELIGAVHYELETKKQGERRWLEWTLRRIDSGDEREPMRNVEIQAVGRDITDRKHLEREVMEMSTTEQQNIGREMHDGLVQQLTGIEMLATMLTRRLEGEGLSHAASAQKLAQAARDAWIQTRRLSHGLLLVEVDRRGLVEALEDLAGRTRDLHGVECRLEGPHAAVALADSHAATQMYRIAQEALTNSVRHGAARSIVMRLRESAAGVNLEVIDDGVGVSGVEPGTLSLDASGRRSGGMGWRIMRYRAGAIGARLEIRSSSEGTTVSCVLPADRDAR